MVYLHNENLHNFQFPYNICPHIFYLIIIKQNSKISNVDKCLPFCSFKLIEFIRLQREKCTKNAPLCSKKFSVSDFYVDFSQNLMIFYLCQKSQKVLQGVPESFELYSKVPNKRTNTIINLRASKDLQLTSIDLQWPPKTSNDLKIWPSHCSKSQIFVQKFNFDKTPTFSRVFHQIFLTIFLVKSKLSTAM